MKTLAVCAVSCVLSVTLTAAASLSDFAGTWIGTRTETKNGKGHIANCEIVAEVTPNGLIAVETGRSHAFAGKYTIRHLFKNSGKYHNTLIRGGFILATADGTWKKVGSELRIQGTARGGSVSEDFSGKLSLVYPNKLVYSGTSGGVRVRIVGKRS